MEPIKKGFLENEMKEVRKDFFIFSCFIQKEMRIFAASSRRRRFL